MICRWAAAWAFGFALVHAYWFAGGSTGLPAAIVAARPAGLMIACLLAVPLLVAAGICVLAAARCSDRRWRGIARFGTAMTGGFAHFHAVAQFAAYGLGAARGLSLRSEYIRYDFWLWEPNWLLGGTLFALAWTELRQIERRESIG